MAWLFQDLRFGFRSIGKEDLGVSPYDPVTLAAVIALVVTAGMLASYFAWSRAARIDPAVCLRND
jgi:ABC-type lipoprotein release transport system permease subunit